MRYRGHFPSAPVSPTIEAYCDGSFHQPGQGLPRRDYQGHDQNGHDDHGYGH